MMAGQHTPPPWECQPTDRDGPDFGVAIIGSNLTGLVGAALPWSTEIDSGDFSRVEANARLIAAAPELLEALESAEDHIIGLHEAAKEVGSPDEDALALLLLQIDAAIAKARGEQS